MSKLLLRAEDLIDSEAEAVKKALLAGDYIICCTMAEPGNLQSAVLENVTCLKETIPGVLNRCSIVEYGISNDPLHEKYRLHDSVVAPVPDDSFLNGIITSMLQIFDLFIRDNGNVERSVLYGKLGTDREDEIVYVYQQAEVQ